MNFGQSFRLAIKSLTTSKMRALLTMLGIIIGVGAVIVILSLGNGLTGMVQQQVDKLGINMIQAQFFGGTADMLPDPEDMYDMVEANADILTGVSPYLGVNAVVRHGSDKFDRTSLYGEARLSKKVVPQSNVPKAISFPVNALPSRQSLSRSICRPVLSWRIFSSSTITAVWWCRTVW